MGEAERRKQLIAQSLRVAEQQQREEASSSSSEEEEEETIIKPVFVPKSQRMTKNHQVEEQQSEEVFLHVERRESVVQHALIEDLPELDSFETYKNKAPPIGMEDTEEAYQAWRLRELKRILFHRKESQKLSKN